MGFALFTEAGTFDPASYGINVGDTIHVVCVGGGAGGAGYTTSGYPGGNGSASSLGSLVTSLGGYAGQYRNSTSTTPTWRSTPTEHMRKSCGQYSRIGAAGWYPGAKVGVPPNVGPQIFSMSSGSSTAPKTVPISWLFSTDGLYWPGAYACVASYDVPVILPSVIASQPSLWRIVTSTSSYGNNYAASISAVPLIDVFATSAWYGRNNQGYVNLGTWYPALTYQISSSYSSWLMDGGYYQYFTCYNAYASGGFGYGAGGSSYDWYYPSGCSGEIKEQDIKLIDTSALAVTIGFGGGCSAYYNGNYYRSTDATSSDPGSSTQPTMTGTAGKNGAPTLPTQNNASSNQTYFAGGLGASGCVAIWW